MLVDRLLDLGANLLALEQPQQQPLLPTRVLADAEHVGQPQRHVSDAAIALNETLESELVGAVAVGGGARRVESQLTAGGARRGAGGTEARIPGVKEGWKKALC